MEGFINNHSPKLKRINLEITYRCNAKCSFCFLDHANKLNSKIDEISSREIKDFIGTITDKPEFYITGGEPFIRKDAVNIIEHIKHRGFACGVNTNGTLLDRDKISRLSSANLDYIIFSLHGPQKIHDAICGIPGTYDKALKNIKYMLKKRINTEVIISCTINAFNCFCLEKIYRLGKSLGVDRVIFEHLQFLRKNEFFWHKMRWQEIFPGKPDVLTPCFNLPGLVDAASLDKSIKLLQKIADRRTHLEIRPLLPLEGLERWYNYDIVPIGPCGSIDRTMVVGPNGDARVCQFYNLKAGNIKKESCREIHLSKKCILFRETLSKMGKLFPGCVRCCQRFKIFRYR